MNKVVAAGLAAGILVLSVILAPLTLEQPVSASHYKRIVQTVTFESESHRATDHENHQAIELLPPKCNVIYTGTLSYTASKLVDVLVYHKVTGEPTGQSIHEVDGIKYSVGKAVSGISGNAKFVGDTVLFHVSDSEPFTVTVSIAAATRTMKAVTALTEIETGETYCSSGVSNEAHELYINQERESLTKEEQILKARNGEIQVPHELGTSTTLFLHELFNIDYIPESHVDIGDISSIMADPTITVTAVDANGVEAFWMDNENSENVLLYFHGGAYVIGSPLQPQPFVVATLPEGNLNVLTIDYRMPPEHPFPAALEDGKASYRYLLENGFSPENIVVSGDSAGGGLILATMLALRDEGDPLPAAIAVMEPWVDLTLKGDTYTTLKDVDRILGKDNLVYPAKIYVGDDDYQNPYISPINGNFETFPPVLIQVGNREVFLSEDAVLAEIMREDGVDVTLEVKECMWHIFQNTAIPETLDALINMALFFDDHLV